MWVDFDPEDVGLNPDRAPIDFYILDSRSCLVYVSMYVYVSRYVCLFKC